MHGKAGLRKVLGVRKTEEEREEMERVLGRKSKKKATGKNAGGEEKPEASSQQVAIRV